MAEHLTTWQGTLSENTRADQFWPYTTQFHPQGCTTPVSANISCYLLQADFLLA